MASIIPEVTSFFSSNRLIRNSSGICLIFPFVGIVPREKDEGDMGLAQSYFSGVIGIDGGIEERFLERGDIHNKLRSMLNAKVQMTNQIQTQMSKNIFN